MGLVLFQSEPQSMTPHMLVVVWFLLVVAIIPAIVPKSWMEGDIPIAICPLIFLWVAGAKIIFLLS